MFVIALSPSSCSVPNKPHHSSLDSPVDFDSKNDFDIAFLEFSEHGNLFDRNILDVLMNKITEQQRTLPTAVIVFVHGWHHNGSNDDANVISFRRLLEQLSSDSGPYSGHRVVGVYIGWRGESVQLPGIRQLTFWGRKTVAEEVGRGGVTEILVSLERTSRCGSRASPCVEAENTANQLIVLGHSFGGAIVLTALSDIFVDRLVNAEVLDPSVCANDNGDRDGQWGQKRGAPCALARRFAHGVVLLNPAIEANQMLPLKELMASFNYPDDQEVLMHVLSSDGDSATQVAFPIGQKLRNLAQEESTIPRLYSYSGEKESRIEHSEAALTETTLGNYAPFRSGWVGAWGDYRRCWDRNERSECGLTEDIRSIPIGPNEPIQVLYTSRDFIRDHGDVFNCQVRSYVVAVAQEAMSTARHEYFSFGNHYDALLRHCPPAVIDSLH